MPPKKTKETETMTTEENQGNKDSTTTSLETRESRKLNEISKKLSLILSAIESLTEVIKTNKQNTSTEQSASLSPAITEMTQVLSDLSKNIPNANTPQERNDTPSEFTENEALRVKEEINNTWNFKLKKRINAYWSKTRSEGLHKTFSNWIKEENIVIPKHVQRKTYTNEHELQRKLREEAVLKDYAMEIELQKLRKEQHQERIINIDLEMKTLIAGKAKGAVKQILIDLWEQQTKYNENISKRRWQKNERWLEQYAIDFLNEYKDKSPFFKEIEYK